MLIRPSFKKSLIVEQFQGNYLKWTSLKNVTAYTIVATTSYSIQGLLYEKHGAKVDGNQTGACSGPVQVQTLEGVSLICYITFPKFAISQSEAVFTVLISRYPAISNA